MKQISINEVKERLLELMAPFDDEGLVVTKGDVPVARIVPQTDQNKSNCADLIGCMEGEIEIYGDIFSTGIHYPEDCHKYAGKEDNS